MFISTDNLKYLKTVFERERSYLRVSVSREAIDDRAKFIDAMLSAVKENRLKILDEEVIIRKGSRDKTLTSEERSEMQRQRVLRGQRRYRQ